MAIEYTEEQKQVINLRNRNLLVSAAAGSGKTAVLVERIIARLTKDPNPIHVDEMLIVTFTKAAAAEMKSRIHAAIEKALQKDPQNLHLQKQATLIHQAQINTIDKFCLNVIRDYFYLIDLEPGYRVVEPGEANLLKQDVVKEVMENAYINADDMFVDFVESFATGKDDQTLEGLILDLARHANQYPEPIQWLEACVEKYDTTKHDYYQIVHLKAQDILREVAEEAKKVMELCLCEDGPSGYRNAIETDLSMLQRMLECTTYEELQKEMKTFAWQGLKKNPAWTSKEKASTAKATRDYYKGIVNHLREMYFYETRTNSEKDMLRAKEHVRVLVDLVKDYLSAYASAKKARNLIDFGDMEHFALQILTKKEGDRIVPSEVAEAYQKKFAEVMIDEYQDSNFVQEAILSSVSGVSKGNYNRFMVGDVKQSIYGFRLSKPELFMKKHETYSLTDSVEQRIDLHKNFRSRREVLDSCNLVFEQIMTRAFGGIEYDENAALYVGADYTEHEGNETELLLLETDGAKSSEILELEAEMIAVRIEELMEHHLIWDKNSKTYRKIHYKDIAILSRGIKRYKSVFKKVFENRHIPIFLGPQKGYFETPEVMLILNYLKALDNPLQDIPFTAVLTSFEHFTSDELTKIRVMGKKKSIYENVKVYVEEGKEVALKERLQAFWVRFHQYREKVSYMAIHEFLWMLLNETGYIDVQSVMPGGAQRRANLEMLVEKAIAYEGTSYKGLFNFVRYIEQLQVYNEETGEAVVLEESMDAVQVMTIHGSKGLEFPIVFLAGVSCNFNLRDTSEGVVTHSTWGVGIDSIDANLRVKTPTLLKNMIRMEMTNETVAEEIRLLYVAMTRAKEKLIMTATASKKSLDENEAFLDILSEYDKKTLPYCMISGARKYLDWILAAVHRSRIDMPIKVERKTKNDLVLVEAERMHHHYMKKKVLEDWDVTRIYDEDMKDHIEAQITFSYPYHGIDRIKQKLSVSELKKKMYEEEEGQEMFKEEEPLPLLPEFMQQKEALTGASKGTAYHKLMELLDFSLDYDEKLLKDTIAEKVSLGYLDKQMEECIDIDDILRFLQSPIGKRMQIASRKQMCFSEQPFVMGIDASKVYPDIITDEMILVQGIVDVYFEEEGELVVLDYKTDKVSHASELVNRYHAQLEYYGEALEKMTGKNVKEKIIYSFRLREEISV